MNKSKIQKGMKMALRETKRFFNSTRNEYRRRFKMNLAQWLLYHQKNIVFQKCHWMGVRAQKNPFDAWIYQEIIYEVKPDIILEIGSAEGGSTLYFANILDLMGKGSIISIDIDRTKFHIKHNRIIELTGDSSSPEILESVRELCKDKIVLIVHDGDHTKNHVLNDLNQYSDIVSKNSYFIVEDGIADLFNARDGLGDYQDGALVAIEEFLKTNNKFVVDSERERYILTYNPKGFLKRIG